MLVEIQLLKDIFDKVLGLLLRVEFSPLPSSLLEPFDELQNKGVSTFSKHHTQEAELGNPLI